jgi:hypothetical protein
MRTPQPPALQVLFEPWPDEAGADRDGYEVFAGHYLLDALDANGALKVRGFRAVVAGCTTCRRDAKDARVHVPNINDLKPEGPRRRCPQWKRVEAIVKAFGGWKRVHYVELVESEGLGYQPIPQRRREVAACETCGGSGYLKGWTELDPIPKRIPPCDAGCGAFTYGGRGEVQRVYEGPVRPDRHGMTAVQLRKR